MELLDEVGNADVADLFTVKNFMVHFQLKTEADNIGSELTLVDKVPSGGSGPNAVAQYRNLVYVLNAGGGSNVTGFFLEKEGRLRRIPDSTTFLTTSNPGAGSLAFSPNGQFLLVTEKSTNNIDAFHVQIDGTLAPMVVTPSAGPGLFAVLFAPNGAAFASETGPAGGNNAAAVSSYAVGANGKLSPISASVPTLRLSALLCDIAMSFVMALSSCGHYTELSETKLSQAAAIKTQPYG